MRKLTKIFAIVLTIALVCTLAACGTAASGTTQAAGSTSGKPVLRVAMECGYAPYNWTQPTDENGAVQIADSKDYAYGYDVMMAKTLAEKIGYDVQIVKLDWDSLIPALQSGTVDCVIAGQSITSERLEMVDFTTPYYYASIVGLTLKGSAYENAKGVADLANAICTSQLGTVWYDVCLPQIEGADILAAQESAPAMLVALESGRVNLVVTDQPTALAASVAYPDMVMLDFADGEDNFKVSEEEINIGVSVKKGNKELLDKLNGALATLTTDDFTSMMEEAISVQPLSN